MYRYKTNSGSYSGWYAVTATKSGNKYSYSGELTGLNYENSYTLEARAYDALYVNGANEKIVYSSTKTVKAEPVFDWSKTDFNFNVPVKMPVNTYYSTTSQSGGGLDMSNSDIVNANSIYFNDQSAAVGEGLCFPTTDAKTEYDILKAYNGELYFLPNSPTNTASIGITKNNILWSGAMFMQDGQTATFSDGQRVSNQCNGIVLVWSWYENSTASNADFVYQFIPKIHTQLFNGKGVWTINPYMNMGKYVYVYDDKLTGYSLNSTSGNFNNMPIKNTSYVLRYVIGV